MIKASIHTFYSRCAASPKEVFDFDSLVITALSVLKARPLFKRMYFFGDDLAKSILSDELKLPFDFASNELQYLLPPPLAKYWGVSKLKSCSSVYEPFVHLDNDVILHQALPDKILNGELINQNPYQGDLTGLLYSLPYTSEVVNRNADARTFYNNGIMGGLNWEFFQQIYDNSYAILTKTENRPVLFPKGEDRIGINQLVEEYMCGVFYKEKKAKVTTLFDAEVNEQDALKYGYTHLAGSMKRQPVWISKARHRLATEFPAVLADIEKLSAKHDLTRGSI